MGISLKRNVLMNMAMTTALYVSQLITYPYITRVLGAYYLGICNFAQSYVYLFTLLATLGISTLGTREIAKKRDNQTALDKCFSRLFWLSAFTTSIAIIIYTIAMLTVSSFKEFIVLLSIGICNIIFNLFLVEWFFRGMENFKYITYRSLLIRIIYIISIFLLIKDTDDYILYFSLTSVTVVINGIINWSYKSKFVKLIFIPVKEIFFYKREFVILGLNFLLLTYYNTTSPILLQIFGSSADVGYFTAATKLTLIILLFYNAYTLVLMPRISSLLSHENNKEASNLLSKSFNILFIIAIPLLFIMEAIVPEIILIIAGSGFEGAILPMRIALPVIILGGVSQITINQVLIPNGLDLLAMYAGGTGFVISIILNIILIPYLGAVASSIAWVFPEFAIMSISIYFCKVKHFALGINIRRTMKYFIVFSPLLLISLLRNSCLNYYCYLLIGILCGIIYVHIMTKYYFKQAEYINILNKILHK